jgi:signal transduction histidine kinase
MAKTEKISDHQLLTELQKRLASRNQSIQLQQTMLVELDHLNDKLRNAEQVKSGFLSNIRNEINNPLTSIIGLSAQLMNLAATDAATIKRVSYLINKEAFALDFQMRNIFSAAEIEAGEVKVRPAIVNIADLVLQQIEYFNHKTEQRGIRVVYDEPLHDKYFKTDPLILQSIVMNVISNAVEFSPENERVIVSTVIKDNLLNLSVQDFGEGINQSDYQNVFDRFHQLDNGSTKRHQGHGLGLSIVKEFIDDLNGELSIYSEKGKTTIIYITLPSLASDIVPQGFSDGNEIIFGDEEIF